jgi:hypothetical protein
MARRGETQHDFTEGDNVRHGEKKFAAWRRGWKG